MKMVLIFFAFLSTITSPGNNSEPEIIEIRIKYQSSFSPLAEDYTIKMVEKKVIYTSPIVPLPDGNPIVKTKKLEARNGEN